MTSAVSFQKVSRHFGSVRAVDAVDLDIAPGEFFAMWPASASNANEPVTRPPATSASMLQHENGAPSHFNRDRQAPRLIYSSQACTTVCRAIRPFFSSSIAAANTFVPSG